MDMEGRGFMEMLVMVMGMVHDRGEMVVVCSSPVCC